MILRWKKGSRFVYAETIEKASLKFFGLRVASCTGAIVFSASTDGIEPAGSYEASRSLIVDDADDVILQDRWDPVARAFTKAKSSPSVGGTQ